MPGWEDTVLVLGTEAARTISTNGERCEIFFIICIVDLTEVGNKAESFAKAFGQLTTCTSRWPHVVGVQNGELVTLGAAHLVILAVDLGTDHGVGTMTTDFEIIGSDGVPCPAHRVLLLRFNSRVGAHHLTL